jgi:hypothetical protein
MLYTTYAMRNCALNNLRTIRRIYHLAHAYKVLAPCQIGALTTRQRVSRVQSNHGVVFI